MRGALLLGALLLAPAHGWAQAPFDPFTGAAVEDRIGAEVPLSLGLTDSEGRTAAPPDGKTILLAPVDFGCANICGITLRGLLTALGSTALASDSGFEVWIVSIDGRDGQRAAADERKLHEQLLADLPAPENVRFLTGNVTSLTEAVGFRYAYDPETDQFAHAAAVAVVTPERRLARWLYGYPFQPSDLRLALVEAGGGEIGTLADRLWLLCYGYDPETGTYTLVVERALQAGGGLTVLALGGFVLLMLRRERGGRS